MEPTEFGQRLARLMAAHDDISQYALAERSGVPQPTIQSILSGETRNPKIETLRKLCAAIGASESLEYMTLEAHASARSTATARRCALT